MDEGGLRVRRSETLRRLSRGRCLSQACILGRLKRHLAGEHLQADVRVHDDGTFEDRIEFFTRQLQVNPAESEAFVPRNKEERM